MNPPGLRHAGVHAEPVRARTRHGRRHDTSARRAWRRRRVHRRRPRGRGGRHARCRTGRVAHAVVRTAGERPRSLRRRSCRAGRGVESFRRRGRVRARRGAVRPAPRARRRRHRGGTRRARDLRRGRAQRHVRRPLGLRRAGRAVRPSRAAGPLALLPAPPMQRSTRGPGRSGRPLPRHRRPHLPRRAPEPPRPPPVRRRAARHPRAPIPRSHRRRGWLLRAEGLRQPRGRRGVRGGRRCSAGR